MEIYDAPGAAFVTANSTAILNGTNARVLFDDGGVIGESAGLTYTKASGLLASTAMAINGATIGTNALAVTGTGVFSGVLTTAGITNSGGADLIWGNGFIRSVGATKMDLSVNGTVAFTTNSNAAVFSASTTTALSSGSFTSAAPTTGTAGAWKLGVLVTTASVLDTTKYIQLDVGGVLYKLATMS